VVGLGYAFDCIAIGWLLYSVLACEIGILLFSRLLPDTPVIAHHTDHQPIRRIVLQPRVLLFFCACFLMSVAHGPYYAFFSIYLVEHGYAKSSVGELWALGVICEIAIFFLMPRIAQRFGYARILTASFALAVLRFLLIGWFVDAIALLLLAQTLHAASFGSYHASSMGLLNELFKGRHQSRGQALFGSLTYGAGGMLGGMASGPVWQHYGAGVLYSLSSACALLGLALILGSNRAAQAADLE
jgi:PPP family 3-phenylpropionic acid transporter